MSNGHARLSPSGAHRWGHCPGSVTLEDGCPNTTSRYADEGTMLHAIIADRLLAETRGVPATFTDLLGRKQAGEIHEFEFNEEHERLLESCRDAFRAEAAGSSIALLEQRVTIPERDDCYGTADVVIVHRAARRLVVMDWKFGAGVQVFAKENPQTVIYALATLLAVDGIEEIDSVRIIIHQPRLDRHDAWEIGADELRGYLRGILEAARRTDLETTTYVAGDWCRFCRATTRCPALRATALAAAKREFDRVESLSAPDLAAALAQIPQVEAFIRAIEAEALHRAAQGEAIPGFKLTEGRRSRDYADAAAATRWAVKAIGNAAYTEPKIVTPAQLEKLAKVKAVEIPEGMFVWAPGKPHLAPESDARPARTVAQIEFQPIDDL